MPVPMLVSTAVAVVGAKTKNATAAQAAASMTMTPQSRRAQAATTYVTMKIVKIVPTKDNTIDETLFRFGTAIW